MTTRLASRSAETPPGPASPPGRAGADLLARHRELSYALHVFCGSCTNSAPARDLAALEATMRSRGIAIPEYR